MTDSDELAEERTDRAEDRTDWAEDRTTLANERTFAGWMRTGMASLAVAIGLKAIFGDFEPTWMAKAVATLFIAIAILIFIAAASKSRQAQKRIDSHSTEPQSQGRMTLLAILLSLGALGTGALLWWL